MGGEQVIADENEKNGNSAQRLIALCKEYTAYMAKAKAELEELCDKSDRVAHDEIDPRRRKEQLDTLRTRFSMLAERVRRMERAMADLARAVSQQVEHADLDFADKLELKLRLAELTAQAAETLQIVSLSPV
jgi:F0F1-type ATP synthase membrane subunit b/b'